MTGFFKYTCTLLLALYCSSGLQAQIVYALGFTAQGGWQLFAVNAQTCEYCAIAQFDPNWVMDVVVFQDGSFATFGFEINPSRGAIRIYTPPNYTVTVVDGPVGSWFSGAVTGPNGLVYINGHINNQPILYSYDPVTQQLAVVGNLPVMMQEIFFIGNELYGVSLETPQNRVWHINLNDPMQSAPIHVLPVGGFPQGFCAAGSLAYMALQNKLYQYNVATNTLTEICNFNGLIGSFGHGLSGPPPGGDPYNCFCETSAGTLQNVPLVICIPQNAMATHNNDEDLDADDLLQFILYSDPADPIGSIIATSATPDFSFAAPLQPGVTYYIAAIAGNDLNGNVDLADTCLDVSGGVEVTWYAQPSVVFSVSTPDVCEGNCQTVNVTFTGVPPFTLTISTPAGVLTEMFSNLTGSFQVCPPAGTPPGAFLVQATALTDAFCSCNN
ncbi:MAG: hypothetical protein JNJ90_16035 [Saprospiraceae bacterium]|nr:hypothetical protein [Saprospiraceae bacterium]